MSGGANDAANSDLQNAVSALTSTVQPNLSALIPQLQLQVVQGTMTPAQAQASLQQQSALNGIQLDPATQSAQLTALSQMQQVAANGGLTAADKAQLNDIQQTLATQNSGQEKAVMQGAAQQGMAGSGADLANRLSTAQTNETVAGNQGVQVAGQAQQRALTAMAQSGQLAQSMQSQQYNQAANTATAQNAINQFNAQQQTNVNTSNAANTQAANATNFNTANTVAGTNTTIANQQNMMPLNTAQQQFTNQLGVNQAVSNADVSAANDQVAMAKQNATNTSSFMNGGASVANALFKDGGPIRGPGTTTSDSIPIRASNGEYVVNAKSTAKYHPVLEAINEGADPEDISSLLDRLTDSRYKMAVKGPVTIAESKPVVMHGEKAKKAALDTLSSFEHVIKGAK